MARDELDRYYTPGPLARACVQAIIGEIGDADARLIRIVEDLHVGAGAWLRAWPLGCERRGYDLDPDAPGLRDFGPVDIIGRATMTPCDALTMASEDRHPHRMTIGNPPYRDAEAHIRVALSRSRWVAYLLRLSILESAGRAKMWAEHPPRKVWALAQRPSFTGGATDSTGYALVLWDSAWAAETRLVPGWDWKAMGGTDAP